MKIAIDAMGGDFAPQEIVNGAVAACKELNIGIVLVGDEKRISQILKNHSVSGLNIEIQPASEVIEMGEHPANAVKRKKDSSLVVANRLVKEGLASAVISAGNTGAIMSASLLTLGRIKEIQRPAIATPMPTKTGVSVLLDAGANADCDPENLLQFAWMGAIYAEKVFDLPNPRVGLLNIGAEETKGNKLTLEAHQLLKGSGLNFIGNIEARDIPYGVCEVIVCDGFVGNIVLKLTEGLSGALFSQIKSDLTKNPVASVGALLVKGTFKKLKARLDYTEYGGAPLLGLNGISIKGHGSSNAKAVKNAIKVAVKAVNEDVVGKIASSLLSRKTKTDEED